MALSNVAEFRVLARTLTHPPKASWVILCASSVAKPFSRQPSFSNKSQNGQSSPRSTSTELPWLYISMACAEVMVLASSVVRPDQDGWTMPIKAPASAARWAISGPVSCCFVYQSQEEYPQPEYAMDPHSLFSLGVTRLRLRS